jgi:predicted RNA-binding protein associated with RNAse of E/G family
MPVVKSNITVIKRDPGGGVTTQYSARLLRRAQNYLILEARFNRGDVPLLDTVLKKDDRFIEIYYTDRWYNIFEVHDHLDDHLKGWYCNVGRPAVLESPARLSYIDLAVDLWVTPDRTQTVLDEDEFATLDLDDATRDQARAALKELQKMFEEGKNPDLS